MKRGQSGIDALVLVDKPVGPTSHDVVARVRRILGEKRVGHMGTLDPDASGLLVVGVGQATRLNPYISSDRKSYRALIEFGSATTTDDAEGEVVREAEAPALLADEEGMLRYLASWVGVRDQLPPLYSAIKLKGKPSYKRVRAGEDVELETRSVEIHDMELVGVRSQVLEVDVTVSSGTYVRSIARDMGEELGSAAHLVGLRRLTTGSLDVRDAVTLEELESVQEAQELDSLFADPVAAIGLEPLQLTEAHRSAVLNGNTVHGIGDVDRVPGELVSLVSGNELLAIGRMVGGRSVKPEVVFPSGISGVKERP